MGSLWSSASDWRRLACLQLGESADITLANGFNMLASQFIFFWLLNQLHSGQAHFGRNAVIHNIVGGRLKSLRTLPATFHSATLQPLHDALPGLH